MKNFFLSILCILAICDVSYAQNAFKYTETHRDTISQSDINGTFNPIISTSMIVGYNTALWGFDRFILKTDYSQISWKTLVENIKNGFKWDHDQIGTNFILHPYAGNLYYNAARSNGGNMLASSVSALGGSLIWEILCENELPSLNDIIATPIGGIALGEVTNRFSDKMIDNRTLGFERFAHEAAVFLINPMKGVSRILNGDSWRVRSTTGQQYSGIPCSFSVSMGSATRGFYGHKPNNIVFGAKLSIASEYGDIFDSEYNSPYDYFRFYCNASVMPNQPLMDRMHIKARLYSTPISESETREVSLGIFQNFDYYDSDTLKSNNKTPFKLSIPASIGTGIMLRKKTINQSTLTGELHLNAVMLAGILTDHKIASSRGYNYASGFSVQSLLRYVTPNNRFSFSIKSDMNRLFTWGKFLPSDDTQSIPANAMGDPCRNYMFITELEANIKLCRNIYLGGRTTSLNRISEYDFYPTTITNTFDQTLFVQYRF